jgi:hypothetical protein
MSARSAQSAVTRRCAPVVCPKLRGPGFPHSPRARRDALKRESRLLLEGRQRWLEEDEHLGGGVDRELLDAGGNGAEMRAGLPAH